MMDKYSHLSPEKSLNALNRPEGKRETSARKDLAFWSIQITLWLFILIILSSSSSLAQTGSIHITSKPSGAEIFIDDTPIHKKTDYVIYNLPVGSHKVTLELSGYRKTEQTIDIKEDLTSSAHFDLQSEEIKNAFTLHHRGFGFIAKGQYDQAIADLTKAIELDPNFAVAYYNRGVAYFEKGRYDLAIADFTHAIELSVKGKGVHQVRGVVYHKMGHSDLAIDDFTKAIELDPKDGVSYRNRGFAYMDRGRYALAIDDFTKAIELDPKNIAQYHIHLGFAFSKSGDNEKARQNFSIAKKVDKNIVGDMTESLERSVSPRMKKYYAEEVLSASQHIDVPARFVAKAGGIVKEALPPPSPLPLAPRKSLKTIVSRPILLILLGLILALLIFLFTKFMRRRKELPFEVKELKASGNLLKMRNWIKSKMKPSAKTLRIITPEKGVSLKDTPVVGNYRVVSKIAAGGMANIYKATHLTQGGVAVLKIPYEQFQNDPKFIERFQREAELGKKLHNENIIRIYESGISKEGLTFIAMEYLEGIDLRQYLNKYGKVPIQEAVKTIVQVCRALDYAHTKGITHRDIKPENIMLPEPKGKGRVVLMDFGVAHQAYLVTVGTRSTYLGTPHYMSPDQLSDEGIDNRSDIYSLGVVLFEMLTGRRPFDETDPLKLILQHKETPPPIPSSLNSKISPELNTLILKMLAKKPEDRYQNVESILVELQEYSLKKGFMFD